MFKTIIEEKNNETLNSIKTILLLVLTSMLFSACHQQTSQEVKSRKVSAIPVGEKVTKIDDRVWQVFQDKKGNYWFGTNGDGVIFYDGKTLKRLTYKDGLVDNTIRGFQGDSMGNVFIETPMGVSKYNGKSFQTLEKVISETNEWKLEPNDLWFNCNGNPNDIYRYDGTALYELKLPRKDLDKAFDTKVQGLGFSGMNSSPYSVFGIDKDKNGNLWIGTVVAGAFRYDGESFLWFPEKELTTLPDGRVPGVRSILEDKNGYFWLSNFISKYKLIEKEGQLTYDRLAGFDITKGDLNEVFPYFNGGLMDSEGNVWMTNYGGYAWKYDGKDLKSFQVKNGNKEILIVSIYQDRQGDFWLGTDNDGVYKFDGKAFKKFEPEIH